jgi:hypothetical protein
VRLSLQPFNCVVTNLPSPLCATFYRPNPSLAPALIEHNLDLESAIEGASAFPQVLDGLKAYCGGEALLGLERCEKEVGEMMRGFS